MLCIIAAASSEIAKISIVYKVNYGLISFALLLPQLLSNKSPERNTNNQTKQNNPNRVFLLSCHASAAPGVQHQHNCLILKVHLVHGVNPNVLRGLFMSIFKYCLSASMTVPVLGLQLPHSTLLRLLLASNFSFSAEISPVQNLR